MVGLEADPSALPKYFPDGEATGGLGYVISVDNRQAPFRSDMVPRRMRRQPAEVPSLEPEFLEAMDRAMGGVKLPASPAAQPDPDGDSPEGRRCADAVWQVLADSGQPMERGEIMKWVSELATTGWGRDEPFKIRSITNALNTLLEGDAGRVIVKVSKGVYQASPREEQAP
jgi:hypothetical protein